MACVLTLAVLENGSAVVGHVGDSRLYQIRRGEIRKITHDHSPVGEREEAGELTEAGGHAATRAATRFSATSARRSTSPTTPDFIEIQRMPFEPDSALVLCSDGLSDLVPSPMIRRAVENHAGDPEAAVRELIAAANGAGGKDNVTVIVVEGAAFAAPAPFALWPGWDAAGQPSGGVSFGIAGGRRGHVVVARPVGSQASAGAHSAGAHGWPRGGVFQHLGCAGASPRRRYGGGAGRGV